MLRSWAMMDITCPNSQHAVSDGSICNLCKATPLMRSNDKTFYVCVCCDKEFEVATFDDYVNAQKASISNTSNIISDTSASFNADPKSVKQSQSPSITSSPSPSIAGKVVASTKSFTPNDDEYYAEADPDFDSGDVFGNGNDDIFLRSSSLISQALLEGWHLLSDICPSNGCNVPLIIHPR